MNLNHAELARQILAAKKQGRPIEQQPSSNAEFNLSDAYLVVDQLAKLRRSEGAAIAGRKAGFTNQARWPILKLDTMAWGYVFNDTVQYLSGNQGTFSLARTIAPRIEPEIVFKLLHPAPAQPENPRQMLEAVEWIALGYEIVDCPYPGWQFRPADMVAAFGFHTALLIGQPHPIAGNSQLAEQLADLSVKLSKNGALAAAGRGENVYGSPLLSLMQVAKIIKGQPEAGPLAAGEVITSGTLTDAMPIAPGDEWTAEVEGLDLPGLTVNFTA